MDARPWGRSEIADRFKALRRKALLTQKYLGSLIGVDRKTINRIENLRTLPWPRTWRNFTELESRHKQPKFEPPKHWFEA
jgi:DNA-binding XRE family transcriptional regulator